MKSCFFHSLFFGISFVGTLVAPVTAWGQLKNPASQDSKWDDGDPSLDLDHVGHNHGSLEEIELSETREEAKLKAKMSPEERVAYDRKKLEKANREAFARLKRFATVPEKDDSPLAKEYTQAFEDFRAATAEVVATYHQYQVIYKPTPEYLAELQEAWLTNIAKCNKAKVVWLDKAGKLYASDMEKYSNVGRALAEMLMQDTAHDRFDGWPGPAKELAKEGSEFANDSIILAAGFACLANCDWDGCEELIGRLQAGNKLSPVQENFYRQLPSLRRKWERELALRGRDEEKNNNPIIELITTKGRVIIELFEDDAPEAVRSTIYLVENGYYSRKPFFRVEQHLVSQTGCEKGDGSGDAGYTIKGESKLPSHRDHFRGSVAIALGSVQGQVDLDSGGAQFYIAHLPLPNLDDQYTVFGRVIEGMDSVSMFRQMNLVNEEEREQKKRPDMILKAKVIRKRDHDYKPTPLTGKLMR